MCRSAQFLMFSLLSASAWAGTITDPSMGMGDGEFSDPINTSVNFSPDNGGGQFGFYNPTNHNIISLAFRTFINPGIAFGQSGNPQLSDVFNCNDDNTSGHPNPFFLHCSVAYTYSSGQLDIRFFDPRTTIDVNRGFLPGGIPPLPPGCQTTPDDTPCKLSGHFFITLNDNFAGDPRNPPDPNGGWSTSRNPDLFTSPPVFGVTEIGPIPEPSTLALISGALILAGLRMRRRAVR